MPTLSRKVWQPDRTLVGMLPGLNWLMSLTLSVARSARKSAPMVALLAVVVSAPLPARDDDNYGSEKTVLQSASTQKQVTAAAVEGP